MLVHRDSAGFLGQYREVAIEVWREPGDLAQMTQRNELRMRFMRESMPKKVITLTVVHDNAVRPIEPELRETINRHIKESAQYVKASVTVIAATGLKAAIVRGIIASLTLLAGTGYPVKITATEEEAYKWLASHLEPPGSAEELGRVYDELRA